MKKIEFNKVTWYSMLLSSLFLFGAFPFLVFYIGREYQKTIETYEVDNQVSNSLFAASYGSNDNVEMQKENVVISAVSPVIDSGVKGTVYIGPACGGALTPAQCGDEPFQTALEFVDPNGLAVTATSSPKGSFQVHLPTGTYMIVQGSSQLLPSLNPVRVEVYDGMYTKMNIMFDNGSRQIK